MDFTDAEANSKEEALKEVARHLSKPEQLDRLDQYKRKVERKKTAIETHLRSAVQKQLEGVQKGLRGMKEAEKAVKEIKVSMNEVEQLYQQCSDLSEVVRPIKEVNKRHQQLRTTTMHIQNIFNVRQVVEETKDLIKEGKLLEAHRNLADLERTRDELLIQLYHSDDSYTDKNTTLHHYFEPLMTLSDALGQQLWLIMNEAAYLVTKEPHRVVTALRIIEREEKMDTLLEQALEEKGVPKSHLPGRPKKWKDKCIEMMETATTNKIDGLFPQEQEILENKAWLSEYLNAVASICYTDLQSVRDKGQKCFPPSYGIMDFFVTQYHKNLVKVISDLVRRGLNARDIIALMIWIGDVRQSFSETLSIDFQDYGPLIDPSIEKELQGTCQEQVEGNVKELVSKMLEAEKDEWNEMQPPEQDVDGAYYTTIGITLFQMIDQNIAALAPLGGENKLKVLSVCLDAVQDFQRKLSAMVDDFYRGHIQAQRRMPPHFIEYMIATANNCRACMEFAEQLRKNFCQERNENMLDAEYEVAFKKINEEFDSIGHQCCECLMAIVMMDLQPIFAAFFTKDAWFANPGDLIDKVEGTLLDYDTDFQLLKQAYHSYVVVEEQHKVMLNYMKALMQKRMVFKKEKEREKAAKMIRDEAKKMSTLFLRLSHATNPKYTQVLELLAELLNSKQEYLPMDIMGLVNKHPDVKANHVLAVLAMRGDFNKTSVVKVISQTPLKEQEVGGGASGRATAAEERKYSAAALKKRLEERNLLSQLEVPNPYSMFGR